MICPKCGMEPPHTPVVCRVVRELKKEVARGVERLAASETALGEALSARATKQERALREALERAEQTVLGYEVANELVVEERDAAQKWYAKAVATGIDIAKERNAMREVVEAALRRRDAEKSLDALPSGTSGRTARGKALDAATWTESEVVDRYRAALDTAKARCVPCEAVPEAGREMYHKLGHPIPAGASDDNA